MDVETYNAQVRKGNEERQAREQARCAEDVTARQCRNRGIQARNMNRNAGNVPISEAVTASVGEYKAFEDDLLGYTSEFEQQEPKWDEDPIPDEKELHVPIIYNRPLIRENDVYDNDLRALDVFTKKS